MRLLAAFLICVFMLPAPVVGQGQTSPAEGYTPARTSWGDPDLQGYMLEYACQEGQQAVRNILSGARAQERKLAGRQGEDR